VAHVEEVMSSSSSPTLRRTFRTLFLAALLAVSGPALMAGCTAFDESDRNRDEDLDRDRDSIPPAELNTPPNRDEIDAGVPRSARLRARGTGPLTFRAADDGRVWVVETRNDRLVYEDRVRRGDEVRVDPDRDRVELNGRTVEDRDMISDSGHHVFFEDRFGSLDDEPVRSRDRDRY
jgi:hypothetical protein